MVIGGYRPTAIVERGGWLPSLGLSRRKYDPELIDRAKMASYSSPYGKMSRLVSDRIRSDKNELLASKLSLEDMRKFVNATTLQFLSIEGLYKSMGYEKRNMSYPQFTDHCFTGEYPIEPIDAFNKDLSLIHI